MPYLRAFSDFFRSKITAIYGTIWGMETQIKSPESNEKLLEQIRLQEEQILLLQQQHEELNAKLKWYEEQLRLQRQRLFGASSEKTAYPEQIDLFNEAEDTADPQAVEPTAETITYSRKKREPGQIAEKIQDLPVEVIDYELPVEERVCPCCNGELHEMSTQVREELKIVPAKASVVRHVQHIYACRYCEKHADDADATVPIIKAAMPKPLLPGSLASASAVAYIIDQKYTNHLPLYRQEQILSRLDINLSRQTMSNWIIRSVETALDPLYRQMHRQLLRHDILHADETTLQVLRETDRSAQSDSYMWLYRTGRDGPPIVLYDYQTTRASKHPQQFLKGFKGYLQTDGYGGYDNLTGITRVGCWAHARRKFTDALKVLPSEQKSKPVNARKGLDYCNDLFRIEQDLKDAIPQWRYEQRLLRSKPILDEFYGWLRRMGQQTLPRSTFGQAIKYCLNQWASLNSFLHDGRLELDNNRAERSIKPFVIGRKNFLFSNTSKGARSSAVIFSIVETAKENGLKPYDYLLYLFEQMPNIDQKDPDAIEQLVPWSSALPVACYLKEDKNKSTES